MQAQLLFQVSTLAQPVRMLDITHVHNGVCKI